MEIGEEKLETIINRTVEQINEERKIMPRSRLSVIVHFVNTRDSSSAAKLGLYSCGTMFLVGYYAFSQFFT